MDHSPSCIAYFQKKIIVTGSNKGEIFFWQITDDGHGFSKKIHPHEKKINLIKRYDSCKMISGSEDMYIKIIDFTNNNIHKSIKLPFSICFMELNFAR